VLGDEPIESKAVAVVEPVREIAGGLLDLGPKAAAFH
jgi:hypothetical protein